MKGASTAIKDRKGRTPIDYIKDVKNRELLQELKTIVVRFFRVKLIFRGPQANLNASQ